MMESARRVGWILLLPTLWLGCHQPAPDDASEEIEPGPTEPAAKREAFMVPKDEGPAVWFLGNLASVKATIEEAGGQWGAIVITGQPGYTPPRHVHHREDESFYVLEGSLRFTAGDQEFDAEPGTFVFSPMGIPHHFVVTSETPAKWLVIHGPTGDFHRFIQEIGGPAGSPPWPPQSARPDPATVREIALKHHIEPFPPAE